MASKFAKDRDMGYEEDRFEYSVSDNFKCAICLNVLKNPKSCGKNQHYFCFGCITPHLDNHHTCPECMEKLTPETLAEPPRLLLNCISELQLKCIYSQRGCPECVQLGRLQNHVDQCGFAPVFCENEGCRVEINSRDKVRHETELCKFRKVECYGCGELKKEIKKIKRNQEKVTNHNRNMEEKQKEMEEKQKEMDEKQKDMDSKMAELMENQLRMKEGVKAVLKDSFDKVESIFSTTENLSQTTQVTQASKQQILQSSRKHQPPINHDVIIMGGLNKGNKPTSSVEKYSCKDGTWVDLAPMTIPRASASSVVFENQIIVSGGYTNKFDAGDDSCLTDSIEILNLDLHPLTWVTSVAKIPVPLFYHQTFLYKGKLIVIGIYCKTTVEQVEEYGRSRARENNEYMFKIYEVLLTPPYSSRELHTLPLNGCYDNYRAELLKQKLFVFGLPFFDSQVSMYDLDNNECRQMPNLPFPLPGINMTTVYWRNYVILLGGKTRTFSCSSPHYESLIDIVMYNTITGQSMILAPMEYERVSCSAVVTDDVIIAMGGLSNVNSVECYSFHTKTWQGFPVMRERRYQATAVVSPV